MKDFRASVSREWMEAKLGAGPGISGLEYKHFDWRIYVRKEKKGPQRKMVSVRQIVQQSYPNRHSPYSGKKGKR